MNQWILTYSVNLIGDLIYPIKIPIKLIGRTYIRLLIIDWIMALFCHCIMPCQIQLLALVMMELPALTRFGCYDILCVCKLHHNNNDTCLYYQQIQKDFINYNTTFLIDSSIYNWTIIVPHFDEKYTDCTLKSIISQMSMRRPLAINSKRINN